MNEFNQFNKPFDNGAKQLNTSLPLCALWLESYLPSLNLVASLSGRFASRIFFCALFTS